MASGPSQLYAKKFLNAVGGISFTPPPAVDVRLWTVAPSFAGTGGTEVAGGSYAPAVLSVAAAVNGGTGQIAKVLSDASFLFTSMPVASSSVVAFSVHDHITGDMVWLNDSWSPPDAWAIGASPQVAAGAFVLDFIPV